jgi:hypothetical protein
MLGVRLDHGVGLRLRSVVMAITPLSLSHDLSREKALTIIKAAPLDGVYRQEVLECWDMVQIWRDWISENFGKVTSIRHRSPPDDPPDLELLFEDQVIGMEHTRLQPQHLGQAQAVMGKSGQGGFIPSISSPPANFTEMRNVIDGAKLIMSPDTDDRAAISDLLEAALRKKMGGMPNGGIIGMMHDLIITSTNKGVIAEVAQNIVNRAGFPDFTGYTLILLDRANRRQFHSSLVRKGEDIRGQMQC